MRLSHTYPLYDGQEGELKCDILNVAPVQNLSVTWYAGNRTLRTQAFPESSLTPVNVASSLNITAHKNLTGVAVRCEAELDLGPLEPEFQLPTASLTTVLDVLCRSSPCAVFTAFDWLRLHSSPLSSLLQIHQ